MPRVLTLEPEMFRYFEMTPDLVCIAGKDGYFRMFNNAVPEKLQYSREELLTTPILKFIHPADREMTDEQRTNLFQGNLLVNFENRYIKKNGDIIWLNWTSVYIPEDEIVFAIAKDLTERKEAEEVKYSQFRKLATHFKASMEKDKKFLAAELHEQLAQLASTVKIDINWMSDNVSFADDKVQKRIEHALSTTQLLIDGIRRISYEISPGMIDDMGLNETLKWFCGEFAKQNGIQCSVESYYDDSTLTSELQLDLYRITQDLLKDAAERCVARTIFITVEPDDDGDVCLRVSHDGEQIDESDYGNTTRIGDIRERVSSINGQLLFESDDEVGNSVSVKIPAQ